MRQRKAFREQKVPDFLANFALCVCVGEGQSTVELNVLGFLESHERKWRGSLVGLVESSEGKVRLGMTERGRFLLLFFVIVS